MPDAYSGLGPDILARSMFFREAEGQPSAQDMSQMIAPYQGNIGQAQQMMQSPGFQELLKQFGMSGQQAPIRQSPFLPQGFMQQHPQMGGALTGAMAGAAATPEAPMVSGAGSGITRTMQGLMGGQDMLRQYQLRQMMAPLQQMGMEMPAMAEQRRQQLLQALMQNMNDRTQIAQNRPGPAENVRNEIYAPPGVPGYFSAGQPSQPMNQMPSAGGQGQMMMAPHPSMQMPGVPGGFPEQQQMMTQGGAPQYHPYDPAQAAAMTAAQHPERQGAAARSNAQAGEIQDERDAGMGPAKVATEKSKPGLNAARGQQARSGAGLADARTGDIKTYGGPGQGRQNAQAQKAQHDWQVAQDKILHDVQQINANPNIPDDQKRQAQQVAQQRIAQLGPRPGAQSQAQPGTVSPGAGKPQGTGSAAQPGSTGHGGTASAAPPSPQGGGQLQYATDPQGQLHQAPAGAPLPQGWKPAAAPAQ